MTANEPRVSDEDRQAAISMLRETPCVFDGAIDPLNADTPTPKEAALIVEALVSHGWAPRPAVRLADIPVERAAGAYEVHPDPIAAMRDVLAQWLRECGIGVAE